MQLPLTTYIFLSAIVGSFLGTGLALAVDRTYNEILVRRFMKRQEDNEKNTNT